MKGRLKDLTFGRDGEQIITLTILEDDFRAEFDSLKEHELEITIKRYRKRRSKDANAYCWVLCTKLAEALSNDGQIHTKDEVYRNAIKQVGVFKDFPELEPDAASTLDTVWRALGTGWFTEQVDFNQAGDKVTLRCYYGSSQYNTKCMSRLIDSLVQDCKALGIETMPPAEVERLLSSWHATERKIYENNN